MKTFNFGITISAFIFSLVLAACSNNYSNGKAITSASKYPTVIERAKKDQRYFLMQSGINLYTVTSVDVDRAKQHMTVTLDKVDSSRLLKIKNIQSSVSQARKSADPSSSEIFLYMKDSTSYTFDEPHTIPFDRVSRVELLD